MEPVASSEAASGLVRARSTLDELLDTNGTIVLVEGESDAAAVATLAGRIDSERTRTLHVVSAFGVTNYRRLLSRLRERHPMPRVVGLYDEAEEGVVRRAVQCSGIGSPTSRIDLERLGFFACVADLEDELIRSIGVDRVERVVEGQGELGAFRILQRQPAQRDRPIDQQLRRFMGTKSTRKIRYGRLLAAEVDLADCPRPLRLLTMGE